MKIKHHIALNGYCLILAVLFAIAGCDNEQPTSAPPSVAETNQSLRDAVIRFLREQLTPAGATTESNETESLSLSGGWRAKIQFFANGKLIGEGKSSSDVLKIVLIKALEAWRENASADVQNTKTLRQIRLFVTLKRETEPTFSFIEYDGKGLEIVKDPLWRKEILSQINKQKTPASNSDPYIHPVGDLVAIREIDRNMLYGQCDAGKLYLLRMMNPQKHAFFKRFDATTGVHDTRLRTIYTASSLYTLMKMYDLTGDAVIKDVIPKIAAFLLSMQCTDGEHRGAFYYSINSQTGEKEKFFVVGTASKTIFTLLELYRRTGAQNYLDAAKAAGDWLLTMQKPDGTMINSVHFKDGQWAKNEKFSTLYIGQVISALSRLYGVTKDKRYLRGAEISADVLLRRAKKMNYFMRDDFRAADDPIPTTWAVQSLLDFYKAAKHPAVKDACLRCANTVLQQQHTDPADIADYGRFEGTHATSGNGWVNEVFMELYDYARSEGWEDCEAFKTAAVLVTRWLIQNTYSPANTYFLPHGPEAIGGLIRSYREESVRTDAVCHGSNGYILLLKHTTPGLLLSVPETISYR
jgi:rhamnogalacturonyl hydrolase YesR